MSDRTLDRRRLLRLAGFSLSAGLAGCSGSSNGSGGTTAASTTETTTEASDDTTTESQNSSMSSDVALSVSDTETDTPSVSVPEAALDEPGWLVVHPKAMGGGPDGEVTIAQRHLEAKSYSDVSLELDRLLEGDQTVFAMLHYDDPADGEFTFPKNGDPPAKIDGSPAVKPFTVTGTGDFSPALSVTDQQTDGSSLTIPKATVDETGWLVVHPEASGGGPNGKVTHAVRQLKPGTYRDVVLELTEPVSEDQTLYGMLHYEDPADDEFTFPENGDPPVEIDGSPAVKPFDVTVRGGSDAGDTASVTMKDTSFNPERISASPGTTVTWTNEDAFAHDVTSAAFHDSATTWDFSSGDVESGGEATYTFEESGIYEYYCSIHGEETMCGVVLVGDVALEKDLPCEGGGY